MRYFILNWENDDELHDLDLIDKFPPDGLICFADATNPAEGGINMTSNTGYCPRITVDAELEREVVEANHRQWDCEPPSRAEVFEFLLKNRVRFGLCLSYSAINTYRS